MLLPQSRGVLGHKPRALHMLSVLHYWAVVPAFISKARNSCLYCSWAKSKPMNWQCIRKWVRPFLKSDFPHLVKVCKWILFSISSHLTEPVSLHLSVPIAAYKITTQRLNNNYYCLPSGLGTLLLAFTINLTCFY